MNHSEPVARRRRCGWVCKSVLGVLGLVFLLAGLLVWWTWPVPAMLVGLELHKIRWYAERREAGEPVRLVGLTLQNLTSRQESAVQLDLFSYQKQPVKEKLNRTLDKLRDKSNSDTGSPPPGRPLIAPAKSSATRDAITLLLQHPQLADEHDIPGTFAACELPGYALLDRLADTIRQQGISNPQVLLEHFRGDNDFDTLNKLMLRTVQGADDPATARSVYLDSVRSMQNRYRDLRFEQLQQKMESHGRDSLSEAEMQEYKTLISR
jgi:hypothetical protein